MIMRELNPFLVFRNNRIQRTTPAASDDFDRINGIRPAAHCPKNITDVVYVDIIIHHNDVATTRSAALALARNQARLARVPGVALLDRDNRQEATAVTRNTPQVRHAGFFNLIADVRGAQEFIAVFRARGGPILR